MSITLCGVDVLLILFLSLSERSACIRASIMDFLQITVFCNAKDVQQVLSGGCSSNRDCLETLGSYMLDREENLGWRSLLQEEKHG